MSNKLTVTKSIAGVNRTDGVVAVSSAASSSAAAGSTVPAIPPRLTRISPPPFLLRLWDLINDPATDRDVLSWNPDGNGFTVHDEARFSAELLPKYFTHRNFTSFVRLLNFYGFHKRQQASGSSAFYHPDFARDDKSRLIKIRRKASTHTGGTGGGSGGGGTGGGGSGGGGGGGGGGGADGSGSVQQQLADMQGQIQQLSHQYETIWKVQKQIMFFFGELARSRGVPRHLANVANRMSLLNPTSPALAASAASSVPPMTLAPPVIEPANSSQSPLPLEDDDHLVVVDNPQSDDHQIKAMQDVLNVLKQVPETQRAAATALGLPNLGNSTSRAGQLVAPTDGATLEVLEDGEDAEADADAEDEDDLGSAADDMDGGVPAELIGSTSLFGAPRPKESPRLPGMVSPVPAGLLPSPTTMMTTPSMTIPPPPTRPVARTGSGVAGTVPAAGVPAGTGLFPTPRRPDFAMASPPPDADGTGSSGSFFGFSPPPSVRQDVLRPAADDPAALDWFSSAIPDHGSDVGPPLLQRDVSDSSVGFRDLLLGGRAAASPVPFVSPLPPTPSGEDENPRKRIRRT